MKRSVKNILFIIPILLLGVPFFFEFNAFEKVDVKPLQGAFKQTDTIEFNSENWHNKTWQTNREEIKKSNIKIRPTVIRLKHELDYRFFNETHMADLLIGKEDYLFSKGWAKSRSKKTEVDPKLMKSFVKKLGQLHDLLRLKGKHCRIYLPPSKEEIYAQFLPQEFAQAKPDNDYVNYINALKENNIPHWDLLNYYKQIMDTSAYPVYSKTSVHWTRFGASFTLFNLLEDIKQNLNIEMPQLEITKTTIDKARMNKGDGDFEKTLNLMGRIDTSDFKYFNYRANKNGVKNLFKPKVLTIGDSYYWGIKGTWMLKHFFAPESQYMYYYSTVFPNTPESPKNIKKFNIVEEFKTADVICFINSPHNMKNYPFGLQKDIDKIMEGLKLLPDAPLGDVKFPYSPPGGNPLRFKKSVQ